MLWQVMDGEKIPIWNDNWVPGLEGELYRTSWLTKVIYSEESWRDN